MERKQSGVAPHGHKLTALLREQIEEGTVISRDPKNAGLSDLAARTTTVYSPWYTRTCRECLHRFREDDRVRLCPRCDQAYHDDDQYDLHCWPAHFAGGAVCRPPRRDPITGAFEAGCDYRWAGKFPDAGRRVAQDAPGRRVDCVTEQFLQGLGSVWRPYGDLRVIKVKAGSPIVGHKCPWCRFEVRAGDSVVKCPCDACETYFHNDIFRHLTCWNGWNGTRGNDFCPTTGTSIVRAISPTEVESP